MKTLNYEIINSCSAQTPVLGTRQRNANRGRINPEYRIGNSEGTWLLNFAPRVNQSLRKLRARRLFRGNHNSQQLLGLTNEPVQFYPVRQDGGSVTESRAVAEQLEPELAFIALLFNNSKSRQKLGGRTGTQSRAEVCCNRTRRTKDLVADMSRFRALRKRCAESHHIKRKSFSALFQFLTHGDTRRSLQVLRCIDELFCCLLNQIAFRISFFAF